MDIYNAFALIYDSLMGSVDYDAWVKYLKEIWQSEDAFPKLIAELGCGTGNMTRRLSDLGYDMIGIDISEEMLSVAKNKGDKNILYLCQDMRNFELYGTADSIISLFDSINYITNPDDLLKTFKLVNNYLNPKGLFVFDLNTEYKFSNILSDNTFAEALDDTAYIWDNFYDAETKINEYTMDFFIKQPGGSYKRFTEIHYERAYSENEIKELIAKSGMELINIYDAYTFSPPNKKSERIFVVARENGKLMNV